ncbi:MAG: DUF3247 family protein [Stenotrophomonas sp.]|jgi:hypothetical protein|nr:DUF3247 family protein [Stenotrophomonas sp.]
MAQRAPRIHTDASEIGRLKHLQAQFEAEMVAELHLVTGKVITGTVPEPPNIQQFLDEEGNEGTNGLLRLDTGDAQVRLVWLDEVERVVRVGTF